MVAFEEVLSRMSRLNMEIESGGSTEGLAATFLGADKSVNVQVTADVML